MHACIVERFSIMGHAGVGAADRCFEPLELKRTDFVTRCRLNRIECIATRREVDPLELQTRHASLPARLSSLDFPLRGVPVLFEICNEGRAEVAIGLLTAIDGHVAPECIEWFFADAKCTPVTRRANDAGTG